MEAYGCSKSPSSNLIRRIRRTASSIRAMPTRPARTSAVNNCSNCGAVFGSMNMSLPALTPTRTLYGVRSPEVGLLGSGIWWMPL